MKEKKEKQTPATLTIRALMGEVESSASVVRHGVSVLMNFVEHVPEHQRAAVEQLLIEMREAINRISA